jgi:hypothetical protein
VLKSPLKRHVTDARRHARKSSGRAKTCKQIEMKPRRQRRAGKAFTEKRKSADFSTLRDSLIASFLRKV